MSTDEFSSFESSSESDPSHYVTLRISSRSNKGIPNKRYGYKICSVADPVSYENALSGSDSKYWLNAMREEIKALQENNTWDLVEVPKNW